MRATLAGTELLIADGHHRYETARVYHQEGGAGHVLMCLVALQDPGLTVFPTHRLLTELDGPRRESLRATIERDFEAAQIAAGELEPAGDGPVRMGYLDGHHRRPLMLTLRDPAIAAAALPDKPEPYRELDTAVLEALVLRDALGMSEDDISHLHGLDYARDTAQARERVESGAAQAAFFMRGTPVSQVRAVAAAGREHAAQEHLLLPEGAHGHGVQCAGGGLMALLNRSSTTSTRSMHAVARQREKFAHDVKAGDHTFTVDEPESAGGDDLGPSPQELLAAALASCTAVTIEMYAQRKGWDTSGLTVDVHYTPAERGCPTKFELVLKMPPHLDEEQIERLKVIAAKCPVHRTLEGEVMFHERVELA